MNHMLDEHFYHDLKECRIQKDIGKLNALLSAINLSVFLVDSEIDELYVEVAEALTYTGQYAHAVNAWMRLISVCGVTANPNATYKGLFALRSLGRLDMGKALADKCIEHGVGYFKVHRECASIYSSLGDVPNALKHWQISIAQNKDKSQHEMHIAMLALMRKAYNSTRNINPGECAACLIVRNEAPYLYEWVAYYKSLGFHEIIIYDNESSDGTSDILKHLETIGIIKSFRWNDIPYVRAQFHAYEDCLTKTTCEWVAFLDADEFLNINSHETISQLIATYDDSVGCVQVNWQNFGSSNLVKMSDDLVLERFTYRSDQHHHINRTCKCIVRTKAAKQVDLHKFKIFEGWSRVHPNGRLYVDGAIEISTASVAHYIVKSKEEFHRKKLKGRATRAKQEEKFDRHTDSFFARNDLNDYYDDTMLKKADKLKDTLSRITTHKSS